MNRFLLDCPTEEKFQEFVSDHKRIGILVKNYDPVAWVAQVLYEEQNEVAIAAMTRVLQGYGQVLRCQ